MIKVFLAIALLLSISSIPMVRAEEIPNIVKSGFELKNNRLNKNTYYFKLQVKGKPLSKVIINLPKGFEISRWVDVADLKNLPVGSSYRYEARNAIIKFTQPIAVGTTLNFYIHGIKTIPSSQNIWTLPISVQFTDNLEIFLIGNIQIQT